MVVTILCTMNNKHIYYIVDSKGGLTINIVVVNGGIGTSTIADSIISWYCVVVVTIYTVVVK